MSGQIKKYCFDTNILVALFSGEIEYKLIEAQIIYISIITEMEFLAFDKLGKSELALFREFKELVTTVYLDENSTKLKNLAIDIRKNYKLKLPDAIIAATALINNATLVTNDKAFSKINKLKTLTIK